MKIENVTGKLPLSRSLTLTRQLGEYLSAQRKELRKHYAYAAMPKIGADYIIGHIESSVNKFSSDGPMGRAVQQDLLNTI